MNDSRERHNEKNQRLWRKFPVILRSVLIGFIVLFAGIIPWSKLAETNLKIGSSLPWTFFVALFYLIFYWKYLNGWGRPQSTAQIRRQFFRANVVRGPILLWSALAGGFLAFTLIGLQFLGWMFGSAPSSKLEEFATLRSYPFWTVVPLLLMGSVFAGVAEEAAFRGYMQVPIEKHHSPRTAIAVVAFFFSVAHFPSLPAFPVFYVAAVGWSLLAYFSNSILPGMVLHAAVDVITWIWVWVNLETVRSLTSIDVHSGANSVMILGFVLTAAIAIASVLSFQKLYAVSSRQLRQAANRT
ncbi:CPBP family intramembrane metalloprotease [bacterium]|nr:CPBP family intramembrane metalloprotease [bacterium]